MASIMFAYLKKLVPDPTPRATWGYPDLKTRDHGER